MSHWTTGRKTAGNVKRRLGNALLSPPTLDAELVTCLIMVPLLFTLFI